MHHCLQGAFQQYVSFSNSLSASTCSLRHQHASRTNGSLGMTAALDGQHHNYVVKVLPCLSIACLSIPDSEKVYVISKPERRSTMMDETRHQLANCRGSAGRRLPSSQTVCCLLRRRLLFYHQCRILSEQGAEDAPGSRLEIFARSLLIVESNG